MRRIHWKAAVLVMLALAAGGGQVFGQAGDEEEEGSGRIRLVAEAQPEEEYPYGPYRVPGHPGPPGFDPYSSYRNGIGGGAGGFDPNYPPPMLHSPVPNQALPPGAQPWPQISPFTEGQFHQRRNVRGLWFDESNSRGIQYHFSMSYLYAKNKRPWEELVGNPDPTIPTRVIDDPTTPDIIEGADVFPAIRTSDAFRHNPKGGGIDMRWGYTQPDDSGFELRALWINETKTKFSRGTGTGDFFNFDGITNTHSIPLQDGLGGASPTYDRLFNLTYTQQMAQGAFDFIRTPWLKGEYYTVKPMFGARYLFLDEKFAFYGDESNLDYLIITPGGIIIPGSQGPNPNGIPAYTAFFRSEVESHLFGPHLGFNYSLGGEYLKVGGYTQGALLGNIENLSLKGRNLGDGFNIDFRFNDAFFSQKLTNSHVSPLFEQHFYAESPLFRLVPYLNKWHILKEAKVRAGYTYISIGEVSRPEGNIVYNGFPLFPELKTSRGNWSTSAYSIGVDWKY